MSRYPIERFLSANSASAPRFRSDGKSVLFLSDITGFNQVWEVEIPARGERLAWPEQRTFAPDRVLSVQAVRRADSNEFIYGIDAGGNENLQMIHVRDDGTESTITSGFGDAKFP